MPRPALFVVKATIAPEREAAFNAWYDTVRSREAAQVPGCLGMRRYAPIALETPHAGSEPWQYMVCYEFDSEASLEAFVRSDTAAGHDRGLQRPLRRSGRPDAPRVPSDLSVIGPGPRSLAFRDTSVPAHRLGSD
jgi:heme-degrading monooxygenase HmoA